MALAYDPEPRARLLFMIQLEAQVAARIDAEAQKLRGAYRLTGAGVRADRLHFTLHHLGDYPELPAYRVIQACEAGGLVQYPAFEVTLDRIGTYAPDRKPLDMVAMRGGQSLLQLVQFQKELGRAMDRVGLGKLVKRRFVPHVTLIYDRVRAPEQAIEPIRFGVGEFSLVHSRLGQTEHEVLAKWSLAPQA